jgi:hypothetical protein
VSDCFYVKQREGPVVPGLEDFEVPIAKNQPQYEKLRAIVSHDRARTVLSVWSFNDKQKELIAAGACLYLEVQTFGADIQPVRLFISEGPEAPEVADAYNLRLCQVCGNRPGRITAVVGDVTHAFCDPCFAEKIAN